VTIAKSLDASLGKVAGISGGAILEDGSVGLVLDPIGIIKLSNKVPASDPELLCSASSRNIRVMQSPGSSAP
jgi:chemotaxis protein histidine kinase CheA